ncbi:MAG TPA: hypothetical protein VHB79_38795 [Polyangiaceae bacterium]|nr:hypothetical protein [Polyangiaceae bacterium]
MSFPAFKLPDPKTPLEHAAAAIGWHPSTLRDLLQCARWTNERQTAEFAQTDWLKRLAADVVEAQVAKFIKPIGPVGARELSSKELAAKISVGSLREAVADYAGGAALLLGKTGVGKTLAALLMARREAAGIERERLQRRRPEDLCEEIQLRQHAAYVAWVSCAELPRIAASEPFGREHSSVTAAKRAPLAVLDDLTWGATDKTLLEILASRYDHGLPTISTAGATRKELVSRFGDAVVRRLLECRGQKGLVVEAF